MTRGSRLLAAVFWMIFLSALLFWLPAIGPLIAGYVGGKKAGTAISGAFAALIPAIFISSIVFSISSSISIPIVGALLASSVFIALSITALPLLIGGIIGGTLSTKTTAPTTSKSSSKEPATSPVQNSNASSQTDSNDIFCPECGKETHPPRSEYCSNCGTELKTFCGDCGEPLPPEARYCLSCGQDQSKYSEGDKRGQQDGNKVKAETKESGSGALTEYELEQRETYEKKEKEVLGETKIVCGGCGAEVEESADSCESCYAQLN